ncbi:UNKNOWN [Stylonychia lemnae]|uniref:Uncharacterized protein n=1 Tax=Stylonychia lemnae TaxID=5949 RepID=A0A077ZRT8_STYLE|nr:UNKNOWN [Stylonychia lemnae]|eukprot:CDW72065.1 UNKNOWN [Stylonychia lemnae]
MCDSDYFNLFLQRTNSNDSEFLIEEQFRDNIDDQQNCYASNDDKIGNFNYLGELTQNQIGSMIDTVHFSPLKEGENFFQNSSSSNLEKDKNGDQYSNQFVQQNNDCAYNQSALHSRNIEILFQTQVTPEYQLQQYLYSQNSQSIQQLDTIYDVQEFTMQTQVEQRNKIYQVSDTFYQREEISIESKTNTIVYSQYQNQTEQITPPQKQKQIFNAFNDIQVQDIKKSPKLKQDQGFKSLFRGFRKSLFYAFKRSGLSRNYHAFDHEKWQDVSRTFLKLFNIEEYPNQRQICALSVMLYHTLGTTMRFVEPSQFSGAGKPRNRKLTVLEEKENIFHRVLGQEGMSIYKLVFDRNNSDLVNKFLQDDFIKQLWPIIMKFSQEKFYFKEQSEKKNQNKKTKAIQKSHKNNENKRKPARPREEVINDLRPTLQHISWVITQQYQLEMPAFWMAQYPPQYMKQKEHKKRR